MDCKAAKRQRLLKEHARIKCTKNAKRMQMVLFSLTNPGSLARDGHQAWIRLILRVRTCGHDEAEHVASRGCQVAVAP